MFSFILILAFLQGSRKFLMQKHYNELEVSYELPENKFPREDGHLQVALYSEEKSFKNCF